MNEFELIRSLTKDWTAAASVVAGIGEDCAVLDLNLPDRFLLFKTDAVAEGVHFTAEDPPQQIGHKALARCLSDIAAMAGTPGHAVVTLALPASFDPDRIHGVYEGLSTLARRWQVNMVGGETLAHTGSLLLSVALLGTVEKERCLLRRGAKCGDAIFVTGELGGSLAGKHLSFEPRLAEAQWLAQNFAIHCMMDLSDGLAGDLTHLLDAAGLGAEIHASSIPVSREATLRSRTGVSTKTPLAAALTDGEDFELIFTVAAKDAVSLLDRWKEQFPGLPLTCIGKIISEPGISVRDERGVHLLKDHGYMHFT